MKKTVKEKKLLKKLAAQRKALATVTKAAVAAEKLVYDDDTRGRLTSAIRDADDSIAEVFDTADSIGHTIVNVAEAFAEIRSRGADHEATRDFWDDGVNTLADDRAALGDAIELLEDYLDDARSALHAVTLLRDACDKVYDEVSATANIARDLAKIEAKRGAAK